MDIEPVHFIDAEGTQSWRVNGQRHRIDGPAVVWADGTQEWYVNDQLHRTNGPAVIYADGHQEWFIHGLCHRIDGPARIWRNGGVKQWWINGHSLNTGRVEQWMRDRKVNWPFDEATQVEFFLSWT